MSESTVGSTCDPSAALGASDGASWGETPDGGGVDLESTGVATSADATCVTDAIRAFVSRAEQDGIAVLRDDRGAEKIVLTIPIADIPSPLIDPRPDPRRDPPREPDVPGALAAGGAASPPLARADLVGARGPGALGGSQSMSSATSEVRSRARLRSRARRAQNRAQGACVNENVSGTHGKATHGIRCARCAEVHRRRGPRSEREI